MSYNEKILDYLEKGLNKLNEINDNLENIHKEIRRTRWNLKKE